MDPQSPTKPLIPAVAPTAAAVFQDTAPHAAAANAIPRVRSTSLNHPPYAEMIYAAIDALKERDGSSRQAIAKYIEQTYTDLPTTHSAFLTRELKRLKSNGLIVMVKKSYKLPRSDFLNRDVPSTSGPSSSGRPRGRPRKMPSGSASTGLVEEPASPNRGPGRPPKSRAEAAKKSAAVGYGLRRTLRRTTRAQPNSIPVPATRNVPRPRGRPKRSAASAAADGGGGVVNGKRRGRPPKVHTPPKRPGRPKKENVPSSSEALVQQQAEYGELKKKLAYFQSRIRDCVGVLKPYFPDGSPISAVGALEQLEGLAAMDISSPLREEGPPTLPET